MKKSDSLTSTAEEFHWDEERQIAVAELVQEVPAFIRRGEAPTKQGKRGAVFSQDDFIKAFPFLEIVDLFGDGHSCQFEAVGEAAFGTPTVAGDLRKRAVDLICAKWDEIGDVVLAEVSQQADIEVANLDKSKCCELLLGSSTCSPLWGNHCTIAQLPEIVKKRIVVLTLSEGSPFKCTFDCEGTTGSIHIGLVPETHFFPVRPKKISQRKLQHGDKGNYISPKKTTKLKYLLGSCGTGCRYVGHKLWLCTSCDALFHHLCHGEGRDMNTCKRCTESNNHRPESRGEVDLVDTPFPGHGAIAEIRSGFFFE